MRLIITLIIAFSAFFFNQEAIAQSNSKLPAEHRAITIYNQLKQSYFLYQSSG